MPPNFFPAYSVFLMIMLIPVPRVVCEDNQQIVSCGAQFKCGNMVISYPFWGGSRPHYCGHPGFELTCDGEAPEFTMKEASYRILDINNSSHTLTVARADYWDSYCPPTYVNTTLNESLFSYNATDTEVNLYYDCPDDSQTQTAPSNQFNCTNIIGYYTTLDLNLGVSTESCGVYVTVPIFQSAATALVSGGGTLTLLTEALKGGFGLEWNASNSLCTECVQSGGQCGYTSNQFTCYCRNGNSSSTCRNTRSSSGSNVKKKIIIVGSVLMVLSIMVGCFTIIKCLLPVKTLVFWKKESEDDQNVEEFIRRYGSLAPKRYNYSDIKKMTKSLAYKLGHGGFGSVYKGELSDGRLVAVKVLSELKGNGEEFLNEVASISRTSHVNIVRLIGFCYDGAKRALIYEFMPKGSLDKFISDTDLQLEWKTMYQIAVGIGRGLEYLHRGCHTRILHFDIKPHNILLDEDFCPKIADFGLAKLCQRKESMVSLAHARGTAGYIAPEVFCRNFGGVSHKSDVYSYGMLVLEMLGGRKNRGAACTSDTYFPDWIYKHLEHGEDLILGRVVNQEDEETVRKMILVSLWCIQTNPRDRPSINKVVEMLEGSLQSLEIPPKPFLFSPTKSPQESSTTSLSAP
ncbi:hypothetical protein PVL29_018720 [Vitis rotundifolia]|uniref:non-specific serine/threonine protein kinase n=1 Tax=Vitis rotundifolia TaxID=103349 RepID=A0AA38Z5N1_VITRO|nr:hypothetical protein PVL29_018720 [Vitis rotundifolia]